MIWLASFPRSGNTFLRNILFEVYGLTSSTYHRENRYPLDQDFDKYPFVKTHELPATLDEAGFLREIPVVCLVRDGRDAMCSIAHHRCNLVAPGSDYYENLQEAIVAERGSFFGGWSRNVEAWCQRADLVMRYEDLIRDPLGSVERLRELCELPAANVTRMPTFDSLKFGIPEYGAGRHQAISEDRKQEHARKFFRRGEAGVWREEMPEDLQQLFWSYHGEAMESLGYSRDGGLRAPHPDMDALLCHKLGIPRPRAPGRRYRVLIEADKLVSNDNDGVKRYQVELLKAMFPAVDYPGSRWQIDVFFHGHIRPLQQLRRILFQSFSREGMQAGESSLVERLAGSRPESDGPPEQPDLTGEDLELLRQPNVFLRFERWLTGMVPRRFVHFLARHDISLLHDIYELLRALLVRLAALPGALLSPLVWLGRRWRSSSNSTETGDGGPAYDLVHIPLKQNFLPFESDDTRKLITFHDLTHLHFPQFHTRKNIDNAAAGVDFAAASGADIIAVSEATRQDILDNTAISTEKVHVIYEAADPRTFSARLNKSDCRRVRRKYGLDFESPYIICLSTVEPRKNLENTIRAYLSLIQEHVDLDLRLVIAGKKGWDVEGVYALASGAGQQVMFTGFVDDADLAYLYSDALCLSYLSFYEGFGLPPLEAMRCGTPVVYGKNSSLLEVAGPGGLPADPADLEDIKQQYLTLYRDAALREKVSRAALRRANDFSWRRAAIETLELYRGLIDGAA